MQKTFGERLRALRGRLPQQELAAALGIPQATLSNYERDRNEPSFEMLHKICRFFNVASGWLLFGGDPGQAAAPEDGFGDGLSTKALYSRIEAIVKTEHEDLRELSGEVRRLHQDNARLYQEIAKLEHENGDLREKLALLGRRRGSEGPAA